LFCCFGMCKEAYGVNTSFISNAAIDRLGFFGSIDRNGRGTANNSAWRSGTEDWIGHDLAVYRKAETLCGMLDASITCPCSVSSQLYRASYDRTCTSEQYCRWPIWYPYLDSAVIHINQMFGDKSTMPFKLCSILQCPEICSITFQEVYKFYRHALIYTRYSLPLMLNMW